MILQQTIETTHVSNVQFLLYSQPVALGLLVELLTSGVEYPAEILADPRDFAFDAFEVQSLLHGANFSGFPERRLRHCSSHSLT